MEGRKKERIVVDKKERKGKEIKQKLETIN